MRFFCLLALACTPPATETDNRVDETGYLDASSVVYTAARTLEEREPVTLVGLAGAFEPPGGVLRVDGNADAVVIGPDETGAFRIDLLAGPGETVELAYTPPGELEGRDVFTLDDDLSTVAAPEAGSQAVVNPFGSGGMVEVDFDALLGAAPPYVAFNASGGLPVFSEDGAPVVLTAVPGDSICIFAVADQGSSPTYCEPAP